MKGIPAIGACCICLTAFLFSACGRSSQNVQVTAPSPSATPSITKDKDGNQIDPDGWKLPVTSAKNTKTSTQKLKYRDGRDVTVNVVSYTPDPRVIWTGPANPGGNAEVITNVSAYSVGSGKVFCYSYAVSPFTKEGSGDEIPAVWNYRYCDTDGDGKFELKDDHMGMIVVPDWAK